MNFNQLEYFIAVAETEHMSRAAAQLNVSQPALSSNIQKLENEIGIELFDRAGRRILLNQYGRAFLPTARFLLENLDSGLERLRDMKRSEENRVVMCAPSLTYYPDLERSIYTKLPKISLSNVACDFSKLFENVSSGAIDFCIVGKSLSTNALSYSIFHDIGMAVLVSDSGPFASINRTELSAFSDAEFASLASSHAYSSSDLSETCLAAGFMPKITFVGTGYPDVVGAVRYNGNVAWVPKHVLPMLPLEGIHVVELNGPGRFGHLIMYWNEAVLKNRPVSSDVRKTIERFFQNTNLR